MKDLLIAIALLLTLSVLLSRYGTPPEQDTTLPPETETPGEVAMEQGENSDIVQGNGGDQMSTEYLESPKTGEFNRENSYGEILGINWGEKYYSFDSNSTMDAAPQQPAYIAFSFKGSGKDLIITFDERIE